ncbi:MAG: VOC family protein [Candidatus Saccharimonadales bacterium]
MKVSSVSGFVLFVKDLDRTAKFYDQLGFRFGRRTDNRLVLYVNWFSIDFVTVGKNDEPAYIKEASAAKKGAGVFIMISVLNVDEFHAELIKSGFKPLGQTEDKPTGKREFVLLDPDGYKLVFFTKK